jgi:hypothetical protein
MLSCSDCGKWLDEALSSSAMHQIIIRLPTNRDYTGMLKLEDAKGKTIAGPFQIGGRIQDEFARTHGNPNRVPVLPFGDTPLGEYQIVQIVKSGPDTPYNSAEFGSAGLVFLQPKHGEAVLADANGRFIFFIQGGALARNGTLRPTEDGSLRLSNRDQRKLINLLGRVGVAACRCIVTNGWSSKHRLAVAASSARIAGASARGKLDHSRLLMAGPAAADFVETSRRSWLRTVLLAAGAFASVPSLLLFSPQSALGEDGKTDYSTVEKPTKPTPPPEPTDNTGTDTQPNPAPAGRLTPFPQQNQPPVEPTPEQKPPPGPNTNPSDQLRGIGTDTNESPSDAQLGFDTAGKKTTDTGSSTVTSPAGSPGGTPPPLDTSSLPADDPDVQKLNQYQQQLKQDQAAAAQAQADYDKQKQADPNANMADLLNAQAKLKGTQDMIKYETGQVMAKRPTPSSPKSSNGP